MSDTTNAIETLPELGEDVFAVLEKAQQRIQDNRRRRASNRFFFGTNPDVDGQPRLTRVAVRAQRTNSEELQFVLTTQITVDGFETTSKLHQLDRYANFVGRQVARIRTQQWVNQDNADSINNLTDQMVNGFGWRLLNRPANLNEERTTRDILVLTPSEAFDPDNPHMYGLPIDFEISGERDPDRTKESFDGDFVSVADATVARIENFIRMTPPNNATDRQMEQWNERRIDMAQDLLQTLSAVTGRYSDEQEEQWAKNCTSGAFRLPAIDFEPGERIIDKFYDHKQAEDNTFVYEPIEGNFEEIRLYGNTQAQDESGRAVSSAFLEAMEEQKQINAQVRAGGAVPSGDDAEFADPDKNPFVAMANEVRGS